MARVDGKVGAGAPTTRQDDLAVLSACGTVGNGIPAEEGLEAEPSPWRARGLSDCLRTKVDRLSGWKGLPIPHARATCSSAAIIVAGRG